jgi:hypothetical protein
MGNLCASQAVTGAQVEVKADLTTVTQYAKFMKEGNPTEALKLVAQDATWHSFSGPTISGRDNLKTFFKENKTQGITRKGLSKWWVEGQASADGKSYTAKRHVSYEKTNATPFRVVQTLEVKDGLITNATVEAAAWEADLEPLEVLRRFASLRAQGRLRDALKCLANDCEWTPFNAPKIFTLPDELKGQDVKGPEKILKLLDMQRVQNVSREAQSDWKEANESMLDKATLRSGGKVFSRDLVITGGSRRVVSQNFVQVAQVCDGRIVNMLHKG